LSAWGVRAALTWLAAAALVGTLLLMRMPVGHPEWSAWIPMHAEMMLVGWMMQLAFGVAHWILPRRPSDGRRGASAPVAFVFVALNLGVILVILGAARGGRVLELLAVVAFALQAVPRVRATGWGAAGKEGDLVRLKKRPELT
jgi:hypothetical protein